MAGNLKGKSLIRDGNIDENVNPSSIFKLAEALIKPDKEFDILILPSQRNGYTGIYNHYFTKKAMGLLCGAFAGSKTDYELKRSPLFIHVPS